MKKIFTIVVAFLMILPCVFCCDAKEVYDVNLDGNFNSLDLIALRKKAFDSF